MTKREHQDLQDQITWDDDWAVLSPKRPRRKIRTQKRASATAKTLRDHRQQAVAR